MTAVLAVLGILLVLFAIPLGLMLAPFILGVVLLALGLRRADAALAAGAADASGAA
ncbi:MAG TPA: hypothetical protein VGC90_00700 [Candidatus Limnocylindrales bacterium]|jgi:hypothetical protein